MQLRALGILKGGGDGDGAAGGDGESEKEEEEENTKVPLETKPEVIQIED